MADENESGELEPIEVEIEEGLYVEMFLLPKQGWRLVFNVGFEGREITVKNDNFYTNVPKLKEIAKLIKPEIRGEELSKFVAKLSSAFTNTSTNIAWQNRFKERKETEEDEVFPPFRTCFIEIDNLLLQQVYDPENGSRFAIWDGKSVTYSIDYVGTNGTMYTPLVGEEIQRGFVNLASEAVKYGDLETIIQEIIIWSRKYADVQDWFREFGAYYAAFTWVYDVGNAVPYLRFLGDTGCGKSRGLDVFGSICYNGIQMNGATTIAPVYRIMDKWHGTLLCEESDLKDSDETNDLIKIINCGIERGRPIMRCDPDDPSQVRFFDPFCPKAFAARHQFKDMATEGRCLTTVLKETRRKDIPPLLPPKFFKEAQEFRNKLLMFRLENYKKLKASAYNALPEDLEPRLKQMGMPLTILFKGAEDSAFQRFADFLTKYQLQLREARANSTAGLIVHTVVDLIEDRNGSESPDVPIACKEIAEELRITANEVSRELRAIGFWTELRHIYIKEKEKTRRRAIRAIVCSESVWETVCSRYFVDGIPFVYPDILKSKGTGPITNDSVPIVPSLPDEQQLKLHGFENESAGTTGTVGTTIGDILTPTLSPF